MTAQIRQKFPPTHPAPPGDGFSKFFDANNPANCKAKVRSTPTVLNICLDAEALLHFCGDKLRQAGGVIWDETEFIRADVSGRETVVTSQLLCLYRQCDRQFPICQLATDYSTLARIHLSTDVAAPTRLLS